MTQNDWPTCLFHTKSVIYLSTQTFCSGSSCFDSNYTSLNKHIPNMFPEVPPEVKSISHYLKVAEEHDQRNIVISYWCRMYAVQHAMKMLSGPKPPAVTNLLVAIMDWLEKAKAAHHETEGIMNETCAQALIEEYALKLFNYADECDKNGKFDKNVVKAFYTSGILFDILDQFGEMSEDIEEKRKYAKWRAAYIHHCLKSGIEPTPGNITVLLTAEDEARYKGFLPKEEIDRIKGRIPPAEPDDSESDNTTFQPPVFPPKPVLPSSPSDSMSNMGFAGPAGLPGPGAPQLPDVPSHSVFPSTPQPVFPSVSEPTPPAGAVSISAEQTEKAQKYCKLANSALNYDDVRTAVENLQKALHLLQFGQEMQ